ncbi:hypothetical protein BX600DRAFT_535643 [Xylariales sp. PMI_506]|nr:hypothetical protein BX600DRAFT_535643 [Xylariales sp. PMI_506]
MPIFKSPHPDIEIPTDLTTWGWLFGDASPYSPINNFPEHELKGFVDAATKERISWKGVKEAATYLSSALSQKYGFNSGDTITLFSQNTVWYPVTLFAAVRLGGIVSGASPAYTVEEMTYALRTAKAKFLATHPTSIQVAAQAAKNAGIPPEHVFLLEGSLDGYTTVKELIEIGKGYGRSGQTAEFNVSRGKTNKDICGFLSFSSGTTGLPKAVMISHHNVIAQALQVQQIMAPDDEAKSVLGALPLFHITGLCHTLHSPVSQNFEVVMLPAFTMEAMLDAIVEYNIREVLVVPPILIRLVRDPVVDKYDLRCIKRISSGAAPVSDEILHLVEKKFPGTGFKQGYGMTESCSCLTATPPEGYDYKYARRVGKIVANTEIKIIKDDGTEAEIGEPGEILGRGPQVVMGYLNNEKATRETFDEGGWLHTGDQGVMDDEGFITITDRIKEMIKVKGIGVAPAELEDLLLGHLKIDDCAVLSIPDDRSGERPKAYVVLKQGSRPDQETGLEIIRYVEERKVRHKWIKEVEFAEAIPKSASGKILRRVLRDMARQGKRGPVVIAPQSPKARL